MITSLLLLLHRTVIPKLREKKKKKILFPFGIGVAILT